jgi:hypothetical protein
VNQLNCFDKSLLAFEVNCTGQRICYSGIFSVRGEPDPDRLRKAILSTARAHPELMTSLCGRSLRHCRGLHEESVDEVLDVSCRQPHKCSKVQQRPALASTFRCPPVVGLKSACPQETQDFSIESTAHLNVEYMRATVYLDKLGVWYQLRYHFRRTGSNDSVFGPTYH